MYRQFGTSTDPEKEFFEDAFGKEAKMDGIARQDWLDYIGPAAPAYLAAYSRMQLQKSKVFHELFGSAVRPLLLLLPQGVEARLRLSGR